MSTGDDAALALVVMTTESTSSRFLPRRGTVTIGRDPQNDVCISDPAVSRRHAVLHLEGVLRIEDIGSANGLRVTSHMGADGTTAKIVETLVPSRGTMEIGLTDWVQIGTTLLFVQHARREHEQGVSPISSRAPGTRSVPIIHDDRMRKIYETVALVAQSSLNILLLGETGVGKEVMAESIHSISSQAKGPMVCLNCAALPESLLESELFGYEAGAFSGAVRAKPGLLELADKGTVLLDEVGELPISIQVKLLRVLEERKVRRLGGRAPRAIDVRFLSATNRPLDAEVKRGAFRNDLFFRLNGVSIVIPPLRERTLEIEPLAQGFVKRMAAQMRLRAVPALSEEAMVSMRLHPWPGNIRELRNVMERAVVLCGGSTILPEHLGLDEMISSMPLPSLEGMHSTAAMLLQARSLNPPVMAVTQPLIPLRIRAGEVERLRIQEALDRCGGNQTQAAELLGISRRTLLSRLDLYGLPRPRKRE